MRSPPPPPSPPPSPPQPFGMASNPLADNIVAQGVVLVNSFASGEIDNDLRFVLLSE